MPQVRPTASVRRHRPAALAALALVVIATVVACSTSDTGGTPVETTEVQLPKSYRFEPAAIAVPVGATVTWTNDDNFTHNVTFEGSEPATMSPGTSTTRTFDTAGTFAYQCTLHPQDMQGTVEVSGS
jgi:plastocyanin